MAIERVLLTKTGYKRLSEELTHFRGTVRPEVVQELQEARAHGDLSENAAKEKLGFVDGRIGLLEDVVSRADVLDLDAKDDEPVVRFGATVTLVDMEDDSEARYQIVGDMEADIDKLRISTSSPVARACMGKEAGDFIEVKLPAGVRDLEITEVLYQEDPTLT
jgi:transcription elongation factor GreA